MSNLVHQKLVKGIVIGGMCSIISLDIGEVLFECLNPVAKKLNKAVFTKGATVGRPPFFAAAAGSDTASTSFQISDGISRQAMKEKKKKKARKLLYKRLLRILLLMGVAYFVVYNLMLAS